MDFSNKYDEYLSKRPNIAPLNLLDIKNEPKYRTLKEDSYKYLTLALSTPGFENTLSTFLAEKFNRNIDKYDKTIDGKYIETHIGGAALHHNLDGSHTWAGAIQALKEKYPEDSDFENTLQAFEHLARDFTTPSGINPFLSAQEFIQAKDFLKEAFHIPSSNVNDLLNLNLTELCGASVATIGLILDLDDLQIQKVGQYVSRLSFSSYFAGNPAMLLVTTFCLGQACFMLWQGRPILELFDGILEGAISAGTFFYITSLTPYVFIGFAIGVVACFSANWLYKRLRNSIKDDLDEIFESQFKGYRSYLKLIS